MKVQKVILQNKPVGMTPFEIIERFKKKNPNYREETVSYAGRLDPMAEGLLLLLVGDENKKRKKYENLAKTYEAEIVFGIKTDTYDTLGFVVDASLKTPEMKDIKRALDSFVGRQEQEYPPYSSKTVMGKPLYWWARKGRLHEIKIPKREIEIFKIEALGNSAVLIEDLVFDIRKRIEAVSGDFRQEEILSMWERYGEKNKQVSLMKAHLKVECSSGTYIRRIASDLGEKLGTGAFCLSIKRTKIGDFTLPKET